MTDVRPIMNAFMEIIAMKKDSAFRRKKSEKGVSRTLRVEGAECAFSRRPSASLVLVLKFSLNHQML